MIKSNLKSPLRFGTAEYRPLSALGHGMKRYHPVRGHVPGIGRGSFLSRSSLSTLCFMGLSSLSMGVSWCPDPCCSLKLW